MGVGVGVLEVGEVSDGLGLVGVGVAAGGVGVDVPACDVLGLAESVGVGDELTDGETLALVLFNVMAALVARLATRGARTMFFGKAAHGELAVVLDVAGTLAMLASIARQDAPYPRTTKATSVPSAAGLMIGGLTRAPRSGQRLDRTGHAVQVQHTILTRARCSLLFAIDTEGSLIRSRASAAFPQLGDVKRLRNNMCPPSRVLCGAEASIVLDRPRAPSSPPRDSPGWIRAVARRLLRA